MYNWILQIMSKEGSSDGDGVTVCVIIDWQMPMRDSLT